MSWICLVNNKVVAQDVITVKQAMSHIDIHVQSRYGKSTNWDAEWRDAVKEGSNYGEVDGTEIPVEIQFV